MKKFLTAIFAAVMMILPVYAEEETPVPEEEQTEEAPAEPTPEPTPEPAVNVSSRGAVLIDMTSGSILFEQDSSHRMDPASLTKLMTVWLGTEELDPDASVTMTDTAFETYDHNYGVLWIEVGETMSVQSAEYAAMLASANDASAMIAEAVSPDQESFVKKMNDKVSQLGLRNTKFENIFGRYHADNYSSANDIAIILRKALENEKFREIFCSSSYTIPATNVAGVPRSLVNDCALLRDTGYYYQYAEGGKIGNTNDGGFALAACAKKDGMELVAVVLGESNADNAYHDVVNMFEYGFDNFRSVSFSSEEIGEKLIEVYKGKTHVADVRFYVKGDYNVLLPAGLAAETLTAEIEVLNEEESNPEVITANIIFKLNDAPVGSAPMEREIKMYDTSLSASLLPKLRTGFDYACIGVLGLFIFRFFLKVIHTLLAPPQ